MNPRILSIDLSGRDASIAVFCETTGKLIALELPALGPKHFPSESLHLDLTALFKEHELTPQDIGGLLTPHGPGSFTGMRIAYASIKAMAQSLGCPMLTVSGSEARARSFVRAFPEFSLEEVAVITQLSASAFSYSYLSEKTWLDLAFSQAASVSSHRVCLIEKTSTQTLPLAQTHVWDRKAAQLCQTFRECFSLQTHSTLEEIAACSPQYLGSHF